MDLDFDSCSAILNLLFKISPSLWAEWAVLLHQGLSLGGSGRGRGAQLPGGWRSALSPSVCRGGKEAGQVACPHHEVLEGKNKCGPACLRAPAVRGGRGVIWPPASPLPHLLLGAEKRWSSSPTYPTGQASE